MGIIREVHIHDVISHTHTAVLVTGTGDVISYRRMIERYLTACQYIPRKVMYYLSTARKWSPKTSVNPRLECLVKGDQKKQLEVAFAQERIVL